MDRIPIAAPTTRLGLAFSVPRTVRPHPLSLRNIFHELQTDLCVPPAMSGDLTRWAEEEGVLLLNCALTVGAKKESHRREWKSFTDRAIKLLSDRRDNLVFLLWGGDAQAKANPTSGLIDQSRHCVLCGYHPAAPGDLFFGCRHFSRTNDFFKEKGLQPIDWRL